MAAKAKKMPVKRRKWGLRLGLIALAALLMLFGWMYFTARTLHVRYAEVRVPDLPASFDGTTILYASDIDLCGLHTAKQAGKMFDSLQTLRPDVLILGGDYTSPGIIERLNGSKAPNAVQRTLLFTELKDFQAPMGKFAISGDNDGNTDALKMALMDTGVVLIDDMIQPLTRDNDRIGLVGVGANSTNLSALAGQIDSSACVIAVAHSPEQLTQMRIAEAKNGGSWMDLTLCGHTHGGQVRIAKRNVSKLTENEERYLGGWYTDANAPLLTTTGAGCEGMNLRLNTQAEVWKITLRTK